MYIQLTRKFLQRFVPLFTKNPIFIGDILVLHLHYIPTKQIGVIALCSCDATDADMGSLGFVLLNLTGIENINARSEPIPHTAPAL
jgi:hypothetical protein